MKTVRLTRIPKWVGTARCAVTALFRRGTGQRRTSTFAPFIPPAGRGRGQRSALSLPSFSCAQLRSPGLTLALAGLFLIPTLTRAQFADSVVVYTEGSGVLSGYNDPTAALGAPSTQTVDPDPVYGGTFPVDPFDAPYLPSQIVGVGTGGSITLKFNTPQTIRSAWTSSSSATPASSKISAPAPPWTARFTPAAPATCAYR